MLGIGTELSIFISAFLTGIVMCLVYCAIRVFRRLIRHSLFWISMEDFAFWISMSIFLFVEIYRTCKGNIRWYFVLGVLCGGGLMCQIIRILTKKLVDKTKETR